MMLKLKLQYFGHLMRRVDSLEKTLMLGGIGGGGEGDDRGWDGWMASLTRWMWVWVNSGSWWWTGRLGVLWFMESQRVRHDWVTEMNWTENAKVGSQEIPGVTSKFGFGVQNEAGQRLTEFCQENTLVITNTLLQQHKGRFYKWTSPDRWPTSKSYWLSSLQPKIEKLYTVSKNKTRSWLWLRSWNPYCQIQT